MAAAVQKTLLEIFKQKIPSGRAIAAKAVESALASRGKAPSWIKRNFSRLVEEVQISAYKVYLEEERRAGAAAFKETFLSITPRDAVPAEVLKIVAEHFTALDRFFLSLTQGRRPRAGNTFEYILRQLFEKLGYPFSPQPIINGQPDFVLPSIEHFQENPPDCIIFTVKRSLRERWRQVVTEGTRGLGFFLATIDEKVSVRDLEEMLRNRITLVVPEGVRARREDYQKAHNVCTFEQFFRDYLDPALRRWRTKGIV